MDVRFKAAVVVNDTEVVVVVAVRVEIGGIDIDVVWM